jgi:double-stranded uracil-DNA glycosylase
MQVESFAPIADERARVLVLGSMPSLASLEAGEYYGHPRNAFWRLMAELFEFDADLAYPERVARLIDARVAVWDVLQSCHRVGSLDRAIETSSEVPNEIQQLYLRSPKLGAIILNGRKAEQGWRRYFAAQAEPKPATALAPPWVGALPSFTLPSTSPAMASLDFAGKLAAWSTLAEQARLLP